MATDHPPPNASVEGHSDPGEIAARLRAATEALEQASRNRALLAQLPLEERTRLLKVAGEIYCPDPEQRRRLLKARTRERKADKSRRDQAVLDATGIRQLRRQKVFTTPNYPTPGKSSHGASSEPAFTPALSPRTGEGAVAAVGSGEGVTGRFMGAEQAREAKEAADRTEGSDAPRSAEPQHCYICKQDYTTLHPFYDQLCPGCAELNFRKRTELADLRGRVALLTGGRVKIGYQAGLKLLRCGAELIVSTRFPRDCARRYAAEPDFPEWGHRLVVYGLDLRHTPSVEAFCRHLLDTRARLDFIVNNACQTVRRPPEFYRHMLGQEEAALEGMPEAVRRLVGPYEGLRGDDRMVSDVNALVEKAPTQAGRNASRAGSTDAPGRLGRSLAPPPSWLPGEVAAPTSPARPAGFAASVVSREPANAAGLTHAARLSQVPLLPEDAAVSSAWFPAGQLDPDLQQVDLRTHNSWRFTLAEVPTIELLEVHLVNAVAPFILNARLKPLLLRTPERDKHIVNVSAMEGQFYRKSKTTRHPHTNMAKAALNMMTRTSAADYQADGIHLNSVDTGWITDEDPAHLAARKTATHRFHPPLDIVDGAARIVDPIIAGFNTGFHVWGKFLKDYRETDW